MPIVLDTGHLVEIERFHRTQRMTPMRTNPTILVKEAVTPGRVR